MSRLLQFYRWIFRIPRPLITRARAIEIAVAEASRRGGAPTKVEAIEDVRNWVVWLDSGMKPSRTVVIDNQTGDVTGYGSPVR